MKTKLKPLLALLLLPCFAHAATIDFTGGVSGAAVDSDYAGLGVTFTNAQYDTFACSGACGPISIPGITNISGNPFQPTAANPITISFSSTQNVVSIYGYNVGVNGARIVAFDALAGGNQVDMDENYGTDIGAQNNPFLIVSGAGIRRVELYQPLSVMTEGLLWDVLTFESRVANQVPEPSTFALGGLGLAGLLLFRRRR